MYTYIRVCVCVHTCVIYAYTHVRIYTLVKLVTCGYVGGELVWHEQPHTLGCALVSQALARYSSTVLFPTDCSSGFKCEHTKTTCEYGVCSVCVSVACVVCVWSEWLYVCVCTCARLRVCVGECVCGCWYVRVFLYQWDPAKTSRCLTICRRRETSRASKRRARKIARTSPTHSTTPLLFNWASFRRLRARILHSCLVVVHQYNQLRSKCCPRQRRSAFSAGNHFSKVSLIAIA